MTTPRLILSVTAAALLGMSAASALAFGPERFDARAVQVKSVLAEVAIQVDDGATGITVQAEGADRALLDRLTVRQEGDVVVLDMNLPRGEERTFKLERNDAPRISLTVPRGMNLTVNDIIGSLEAGSGLGRVDVALKSAATMTFGTVDRLIVDAKGALNLQVDEVREELMVSLHGASNVQAGETKGPVDLKVRGVGNVDVDRVDGPVRLSLNGIGRINVSAGHADTLDIDASGLGAISFDGEAERRAVSKSGMARISYQGKAL